MKLTFSIDQWELKAPFMTATETVFSVETLTVYLEDDGLMGRGEALGVNYRGETAQSISHQVMGCSRAIEAGLDRSALQHLLPPGGARNAVDCALWDLDCKRRQQRAWELADLPVPAPVSTLGTVALAAPAAMAREAVALSRFSVLKLKLDKEQVPERLAAVRAARPDAELLIDANGSWDRATLDACTPALAEHRVAMLEQPLPPGEAAALAALDLPVPVFADEACQDLQDLEQLTPGYDGVNIKLDKCGGLTEALAMVEKARQLGLQTMVGNMLGSSLAMAPAVLVAQDCRWVDLDGPLWQRADREAALQFEGERVEPPLAELWG